MRIKKIFWRVGARLLFFFLALFFLSCSQAEPKIVRAVISLAYYQGQSGIQESYSFFVLPDDADGVKDLDTLYLYHDKEELVWTLSSDDWMSEDVDGKTWIGSRSISMSDAPLPRGQFRAALEDKGGSRGERTFAFDGTARHPFPVFTISGGQYRIESAYPVHSIVWYNENGESLGSSQPAFSEGNIEDLEPPQGSRSAALWAEDPGQYTSALTQVLPLYGDRPQ
jgi:hypothetical protein